MTIKIVVIKTFIMFRKKMKYLNNICKLFECNLGKKIPIKNKDKSMIFEDNTDFFSGETIIKIIGFVNFLHEKYKRINMPITFCFGNVKIADKLSYILFECICYSLIVDYKHIVHIYWNPIDNIQTDGVFSSPLKLLNKGNVKSLKEYLNKFKLDIYRDHFRKIIDGKQKEQTNYLGNLFQDLEIFLKYFNIDKESRNQISEVITELVGNACEHASSDCLLDIDVTHDHSKKVENIIQNGKFYGINIVIINFSKILLGTNIKTKLYSNNIVSTRYVDLFRAYQYHKTKFSNEYTEDDFCNIAALQDKISGRPKHDKSGGTGLTKLIHSLQEKSDMNSCYVVSGNHCILFLKDMLNYNEENWLGFNKDHNFMTAIPDEDVVVPCYAYIPGTAYNLNFIMRREDDIDE